MSTEGCIIYSADGDEYLKEAVQAALLTKKHTRNNTKLILHTDQNLNPEEAFPFDQVFVKQKPESFEKKPFAFRIQGMIHALKELNFNRFLFLDTDVFLHQSEGLGIFNLLDQFDIACAHAPGRHAGYEKDPLVPQCFPEFNCGVILCNNKSESVISKWLQLYLDDFIKHRHDQGAFRRAIYFSKLRIATLTPEYNNRTERERGCYIWHNREALKNLSKRMQKT